MTLKILLTGASGFGGLIYSQEHPLVMPKKYADETAAYIRGNYSRLGAKAVGEHLGLPEASVRYWASKREIKFVRPLPPTLQLIDVVRAYVAGVIDGEGSVSLHNQVSHGGKHRRLVPKVVIVNTNTFMLSQIQKMVGFGTLRLERKKSRYVHRKDSWVLEFMGHTRVYQILGAVKDILIDKKERAEIVFSFCSRRILTPYNDKYTTEDWADRERILLLNRKGVV